MERTQRQILPRRCSLKGDCTISSYYTKVKKLWQELDNSIPIPASYCVDDCKAIHKIHEQKDNDQVIRFLKGLKEKYSDIKVSNHTHGSSSNIGKVYFFACAARKTGHFTS